MNLETKQQAVNRCLQMCDDGYSAYNHNLYQPIVEALKPFAVSGDPLSAAISLAQAGQTLTSPRFAYPHIAEQLRKAQEEQI